MDLRQILLALRARHKLALLLFLATFATVIAASVSLPKKYTATTSLVIDTHSPDPLQALFLPNNLATQVNIIQSDRVAQRVVKLLKLDGNPALKEQWLKQTNGNSDFDAWAAGLVRLPLKVKPESAASIIDISYTSLDPTFAAAAANAFAQAYVDTVVALKVGPAAQYASWYEQQMKTLRANLEQAQARLSAYQQKNGIMASDDRMDAEASKLAALTGQLAAAEGQSAQALGMQRSGSATAALPAVQGNAMVQQLRSQIDDKEAELENVAVNYGTRYPKYRSLKAQLDELKRKLAAEVAQVARGFAAARGASQRTEAELRATIAREKSKLLDLKSKRDQMDVLKRDVDTAQAAYDAVARRLSQSRLESRATETNVTILTPATVPTVPSFPKPMRIMAAIAVFLGLVLGVGGAVLLEMLDRRVRSVDDLAEMLQLPVLGVIENRRGRRPRTLPQPRPLPLPR